MSGAGSPFPGNKAAFMFHVEQKREIWQRKLPFFGSKSEKMGVEAVQKAIRLCYNKTGNTQNQTKGEIPAAPGEGGLPQEETKHRG